MPAGVALVTGAGRGIGAAIAERLAADGLSVAVAARSADAVNEVARRTGALPLVVDITDGSAVSDAVANVERELGPIDLLVNNAGTAGASGLTWDKDPSAWWQVFEVNVLGAFLAARAVLPAMIGRKSGRIVNVASNAAFFPIDDDFDAQIDSAYLASKAALVRLTEALAAEAKSHGVRVFAISPGMVKTAMTETIFADLWDEPDVWSTPEDAAELVAALATGEFDSLSGRYLHVRDDWRSFPARAAEIETKDLHAVRLQT